MSEYQVFALPCAVGLTARDRLKKAEIIPTVIDTFNPLLTVNITWPKATAEYGNTVNPDKTQDMPEVTFFDSLPGSAWPSGKTPQLTLAMSDPDAPSRDNPEWSEICHWIATDIALSMSEQTASKGLKEVMSYKPPGPPPKTGKHRYVFVALAPANGTTETLHLRKPGDRQHWGYDKERQGLRMWAEEMGLGVVGESRFFVAVFASGKPGPDWRPRCKLHLRAERRAVNVVSALAGDVSQPSDPSP